MNCFDCAARGNAVTAVAVCVGCGAAVCADHAHLTPRWLTRTAAINRTLVVPTPARALRCGVCEHAYDMATHPATSASVRP